MANTAPEIPQAATIDYEELTQAEKQKVDTIKSQINVEDTNGIIQYGVASQSKISSFSDTVLDNIRNKDTGYVGEILSDLIVKIKDVNVDSLSSDQGFFSKLFGGIKNAWNHFVSRYESVSVNIEKITDELEKSRIQLLRDVTMLDSLFQKNLEYLKELDLFIIAGTLKLKELQEVTLPELQKKAQASTDPFDAQRANDFVQLINRFEKKLHDLKLSRMLSIQSGPQIRLIQNNDQVLVEKIQSSILTTIPLWKNQIIIAISLYRQQKSLELQKSVTDTTNQLLQKNSEMLKMGTIGVAKESERGLVEVETLKKINSDLITTIEETIKIQAEGRTKRAQAEVELKKMETELKEKLISVKQGAAGQSAAETSSEFQTLGEQQKSAAMDTQEIEIVPLKQKDQNG